LLVTCPYVYLLDPYSSTKGWKSRRQRQTYRSLSAEKALVVVADVDDEEDAGTSTDNAVHQNNDPKSTPNGSFHSPTRTPAAAQREDVSPLRPGSGSRSGLNSEIGAGAGVVGYLFGSPSERFPISPDHNRYHNHEDEESTES
jgi:hypothetical protein